MKTYQTSFNLTAPVNDLEKANAYLQADDMTNYLVSRHAHLQGVVTSIIWELTENDRGQITVKATRHLSAKELKDLSDFVRGQNSDGLGEGFEQVFRFYDPEYHYRCRCSFEWVDDEYIFTEISEK